MRLELEKKQKKCDKQNTLHTYDGRLRLRESDDDESSSGINSTNIHNQTSLGRLVNYNPANNLLYATASTSTTVQSSPNVILNSIEPNHLNAMESSSRTNCVSSLDLHYEFRPDYTVDATDSTHSSYAMLYPNTSYYNSAAGQPFVEYNSGTLTPSFSTYSPDIPFNNSLMNGNLLSTPSSNPILSNGTYAVINDNGLQRLDDTNYYKEHPTNSSCSIVTRINHDRNRDLSQTAMVQFSKTATVLTNDLTDGNSVPLSTAIHLGGATTDGDYLTKECPKFATHHHHANKLSATQHYNLANNTNIQLDGIDQNHHTVLLTDNKSQNDHCLQYQPQ